MGKKYISELDKYFSHTEPSNWSSFKEDNINLDSKLINKKLNNLWDNAGVDSSQYIDIKEWFYNISNTFGRTRCLAPWRELRIRPNGDVYFCPDLYDYSIGNISESSFKEIWEGDKADKFRNVLRYRLLSMCNRCCDLYTDFKF
jgi:radical SAM protein with 4Fe4S-binding SPASM domain